MTIVRGALYEEKPPLRLTHAQYMDVAPTTSPVRIDRYTIRQHLDVHWHEFYEVSFVLSGAGVHLLNGVAHPLRPGSVYLLTPADFHAITPHPGEAIDLYNAIFPDQALRPDVYSILFGEAVDHLAALAGPDAEAMHAEFRRIWSEAREPRRGSDIVIRGALERILIDLARRGDAAPSAPARDGATGYQHQHEQVRRALVYIHHHFREPLGLGDVAQYAGLSPHYFSARFHQATGSSFQGYLQELRLRFALSLLTVSALPVTDICYASGFNTLSHFDRTFKARFGRSPRGVREGRSSRGER